MTRKQGAIDLYFILPLLQAEWIISVQSERRGEERRGEERRGVVQPVVPRVAPENQQCPLTGHVAPAASCCPSASLLWLMTRDVTRRRVNIFLSATAGGLSAVTRTGSSSWRVTGTHSPRQPLCRTVWYSSCRGDEKYKSAPQIHEVT